MKMIDYGCEDKIRELDSYIVGLQKDMEALRLENEKLIEVVKELKNEN